MHPERLGWCGVVLMVFLSRGFVSAQTPPPSGHPPAVRTVVVEGRSALPDPIARDEAIRDALRNAVEQAAGLFIRAQSETENFQLVRDVILSRARGFVRNYQVIKQGRTPDGVYAVTVRAEVVAKEVADQWLEVRALLLQKGMPRMMVYVAETVDGRPTGMHTAQARFESVLLEYGIPQVDRAQVKDNDRRDLEAARIADDLKKVATIASRYKADIVILGNSRATLTSHRPIYGIQTFLYTGSVELRAVRTTNARLLFSDTVSASKGDRNRAEAARKALEEAGKRIARRFLIRVMDTWIKELSKQVGTDYDLEISNIPFRQLTSLLAELKANPKLITHAELKDYRNETALLVVGSTTSSTNLAAWLEGLKSARLKITALNPGSIKARAVSTRAEGDEPDE